MRRWGLTVALLLAVVLLAAAEAAAGPGDRLDHFRELAARHLGALEAHGESGRVADVTPLYAIIDEEIIESLESGAPFASAPFIQGQLDGFANAWGGVSLAVHPVGGSVGRPPLLVGTFVLGSLGRTGSVRVYTRAPSGATLVGVSGRDGVPEVLDWPSTRGGEAQFLVQWRGETSSDGTQSLRLDLWRQTGPEDVRLVWSTSERFPGGLWVRSAEVRPGEVLVHHALRYPGWKPGCEEQTEQEDTYRYVRERDVMVLVRNRVVNAWHRDLQSTVTRFFEALHRDDRSMLVELIPDGTLRGRLPTTLGPEPACDARVEDQPGRVTVAATENRAGRATPWSLVWARGAQGWRLTAASPVLE
jgi:hypothetical protein